MIKKYLLIIGSFLTLFVSLFIWVAVSPQSDPTAEVSQVGTLGGNFTLTGHEGKPVKLSDFQGKVVLLTFGYTYCPDVCPVNLSRLQQIVKQMGTDAEKVQVLFISVDPARDTPERLQEYVHFFHENFIGLTGTDQQIAATAKQYGAMYLRQELNSAAGYLFAHTDKIYVVDEVGMLRTWFDLEEPMEAMVEKIQQFLQDSIT